MTFLLLLCLHLFQIGVPGVILFAVGVPLAMLVFLWAKRHSLHDEHFEAMWGFMYEVFFLY